MGLSLCLCAFDESPAPRSVTHVLSELDQPERGVRVSAEAASTGGASRSSVCAQMYVSECKCGTFLKASRLEERGRLPVGESHVCVCVRVHVSGK